MQDSIIAAMSSIITELYGSDVKPLLTKPESKFGDYATNVALQLAGVLGKNSRDVAEELKFALVKALPNDIQEVTTAGPGFLNFTLTDSSLLAQTEHIIPTNWSGQVVVAEYSDPNPFKVLHAGHLYTSLVGDVVANLLELAGAKVHRVNFGGDVGMHVGKTMWAIMRELANEPAKLSDVEPANRLQWLSDQYVTGNNAYDDDPAAKENMVTINKQIYEIHANNDKESPLAEVYWTCRKWSYDGFDALYELLQMHPFEKYYPESEVSDKGLQTVKAHIGSVYEQSDGAVIFRGEPFGLFTQVFINGEGLPTYAAKDVGLIQHKYQDFHYDVSFIMTDVSQKDHLAVVMKSIEQFEPVLVAKTIHKTHGRIKLAGGVKMSSRLGNILAAQTIIDVTHQAALAARPDMANPMLTVLGAIRFSFLKNRIGSDIIYDPAESVSLEGSSGPYLQYAHARARSILAKSSGDAALGNYEFMQADLQAPERALIAKITEYSSILQRSVQELLPHHICGYLYELAQEFNRFYEHNRVIGDERQALRLAVVERYASTLSHGLGVLGIQAPQQM